ncbi:MULTISPECIES: phage integrase central domain-containing protein [Sphingobium]|uniref:tyrosine-type recombinase/integrase n=1 Tax=Sphingobium TaxID=165695 RepID=UPI0010F70B5C|nr:integrase arm-type DNA-binding domain-containing protein [Sphingobium sp. RSMS]UXC93015.1 integrase arm-type DNA-binding domain-containing protein [Sphingobium sp. RSMS]
MLTNSLIQSILPSERPVKKADGGGLHICVLPNGKAQWRLSYRFDYRQKTLKGGTYPEVSIDRARVWREEMKALLAEGKDPAHIRLLQKYEIKAENTTFQQLAEEWLAVKREGWSARYAGVIERRLEADIFPVIGKKKVRAVIPQMMLEALQTIQDRGALEMAHRVRGYCSEIFRYGIPSGRVMSDPCSDLGSVMRKRARVKHRSKVPITELPRFFAALNADTGSRLSHLALRWTILTMVRTQETRHAQWSEFEGLGGPKPLWRTPAARMKMQLEHLVPLPPQAVELLRELKELNVYGKFGNERFGQYLFPVIGNTDDTISSSRMLVLLRRLGVGDKATVHGFRSVASTILNESGRFNADWIEMQLAHVPQGVRSVYNAALYLDPRRKMMKWWADYLDDAERASKAIVIEEVAPKKKPAEALGWFQSSW